VHFYFAVNLHQHQHQHPPPIHHGGIRERFKPRAKKESHLLGELMMARLIGWIVQMKPEEMSS
jgi:hypothetical protein